MGNITETSVFEAMNQFDTSLNETIYNSSHMIGVSEVGPNVREISLLALLDEGGALINNDGIKSIFLCTLNALMYGLRNCSQNFADSFP